MLYMEDAVKNQSILSPPKNLFMGNSYPPYYFGRSIIICFVTLITLALFRRIVLKAEQYER